MAAYYNEIDPFAAAWLRELIKEKLIAYGEVDERSIADVQAADVRGFTQCHFFAGIGGWSYALRLAGWSDDRPVWTGSCPCQGYSSAGKQAGAADARNLWPTWFRLIQECRPVRIFGEQVANAAGHGWLDAVSTDVEAEDYAIGAAVLGAHSVGAPHIRQRLYFVAECRQGIATAEHAQESIAVRGAVGTLDISELDRTERTAGSEGRAQPETSRDGQDKRRWRLQVEHASVSNELGDTGCAGLQRRNNSDIRGTRRRQEGRSVTSASAWADSVWIECRDGKARPTQPDIFPLAHGIPNRMGTLRGAGNAIVPQVAAAFIRAYREAIGEEV